MDILKECQKSDGKMEETKKRGRQRRRGTVVVE
jgi:hypothetical protein